MLYNAQIKPLQPIPDPGRDPPINRRISSVIAAGYNSDAGRKLDSRENRFQGKRESLSLSASSRNQSTPKKKGDNLSAQLSLLASAHSFTR